MTLLLIRLKNKGIANPGARHPQNTQSEVVIPEGSPATASDIAFPKKALIAAAAALERYFLGNRSSPTSIPINIESKRTPLSMTPNQNISSFIQLPYSCYQNEVVSGYCNQKQRRE